MPNLCCNNSFATIERFERRDIIGVYIMGVYLIGVYLIGVHLTGVHLTGVYLINVHLRRPPHWACISRVCTSWACLIPLSLLIMFPFVSSAVFLSVCPSLIAVGFGSSSQLLSRGFSFRHDVGEGGRWKEGEGRKREGTRC
jgi:hypothetical protein